VKGLAGQTVLEGAAVRRLETGKRGDNGVHGRTP
jgi:hypothetical protein